MKFETLCESKTGSKPKKYTCDNQDAFYTRKNEKWCCVCIADGAGSKRYASLGAKWLTYDISEYMIENADRLIECEESQLHSEVMEQIKLSLNRTAEYQNVEYSELSSTLLCVLTNGQRCLILHMGDGVILAIRAGYLNVLSFPMNGHTKRTTALTTMITAEQHLRIKRIPCDSISIIWLMTDGAMYQVFEEYYGLKGEKLSMPLIRKKLSEGNADDATYGYIKWRI